MRYLRTGVMFAMVAMLLAFGSTEAQTQADVVGRYTLTQLNGSDLPGITERSDDCQEQVTSGTLTLMSDGRWRFEFVERETCGGEVDEDRESNTDRYTVEGNTIRFSDDTDDYDADDLDIEDLATGMLDDEGVLKVTLEDGRTVLTFRRADS